MGNMLDHFGNDVFGITSLTQSINKLPFKPSRIGEMGLFQTQGVATTSIMIEEQEGQLALLPTMARGSNHATNAKNAKRLMRSFAIPHIPHNDTIMAESFQNVRAFGSENTLQTLVGVVNDKLAEMKQNHEVTLEYHRIGALQGLIKDADGSSTIYNLWTEYNLSRTEIPFALEDASVDVRQKCLAVKRAIEDALGATMYTEIRAICGKDWFDAFIGHEYVRDAYHRYQDSINLRNDPRKGFEFAGIVFEEYRGKVGNVDFIDDGEANFFPTGVNGLFKTFYAPADYIETVNTIGLPMYAKQERLKFDKGVELQTQSNPLCICTRPKCLVLGS